MVRRCITVVAVALFLTATAHRAVAQDQDKECLEMIRKAVQAHGGQKALENYKAAAVKTKGTVHVMGGIKFTTEDRFQLPDKYRTEIELDVNGMNIKIMQAFDGKQGWLQAGGNTLDLDDKMVSESKSLMYGARIIGLVDLLKDKNFQFSPLGEAKVTDRPAVGVLVKLKGQRDVSLFFDKQNGMLVKSVMVVFDPMSQMEVTQEKIYSEYKAVEGRQVPYKIAILQDGNPHADVEITDVSVVDRHDPSVFAKQ
jgi:hypothetical protein